MVKECAVCAGLAVISFVLGTAVTTSAMQAPSPSPSAGATTSPTTAASAAATAVPTAPQAVLPTPTAINSPSLMNGPSGAAQAAIPLASAKPTTPTAATASTAREKAVLQLMRSMNAKYAIYAAVSVASFAVGSAVMTKAAPTPTPAPSASASASASPSASPKAPGTTSPLPKPTATGVSPGLSVQVLDGKVNVQNAGAATTFAAGQFGFTPSLTPPPVIVPTNPALQFIPPPAFSSTPGAPGTTAAKPGTVDCIVR